MHRHSVQLLIDFTIDCKETLSWFSQFGETEGGFGVVSFYDGGSNCYTPNRSTSMAFDALARLSCSCSTLAEKGLEHLE